MLSRVADNLLWLGRYVERAENTARIIDVNFRLLLDRRPGADQSAAWDPLVTLVPQTQALFAARYAAITQDAVCRFMTFDGANPNSILSTISYARENARSVRESISSEMWELLNTLYLSITGPGAQKNWAASPHAFYRQVQYGSLQFQGVTDATMSRDEGWHFIQVGKFLERADSATRILDTRYRELAPARSGASPDALKWIALLKSCSAFEAYCRRRQQARFEAREVAEFLLLDPLFPRSVLFCIDETWQALKGIGSPGTTPANRAERSLGLLRAQLEFAHIDDVLADLHAYLDGLQRHFNRVGEEIQQVYLQARARPAFSTAETRAAQAMGEQQ
jgi:uncharacterized alpha-E superfamily protein